MPASSSIPPLPAAGPAHSGGGGGIVVSDLAFHWPDGTVVFDGLTAAFPDGITALVGRNGAGKTTLFRLLTGDPAPGRGSVSTPQPVAVLPQDVTLDADRTVAETLGVSHARDALRRIEDGSVDPADFDAVGEDWDVDARCRAMLGRLGLQLDDLDRTVGTVSGGEATLIALAGILLAEPEVLLLDEPTNNLDVAARRRLLEVIGALTVPVLLVSHDLDLLESVDATAELRDGRIRLFGGPYSHYREVIDAEQSAATQRVSDARGDLRKQRAEMVEARVKLDRRQRYGKKMQESKREPKMIMGLRKREAQVSAGKLRGAHEGEVERAADALEEARNQVRDDKRIRIDLPECELPARREVLTTPWPAAAPTAMPSGAPGGAEAMLAVVGPERIGVVGRNGSGKTTLLRAIIASGDLRVPAAYLPQRLDFLDDGATIAEAVADARPGADSEEVHAHLARLLFRGRSSDKRIGALSGGERLRAALGVVLFRRPAPQLLMLDEPTNNLDIESVEQLADALRGWPGALIVVSHDMRFLEEAGVDRRIEL
ncbi:ABC-F family ATP-binding cassette domain-containing protein [Tomitella fengzijianii]|uniref:ABC-F family ATP-binding cassette domain-containing protein n=1 Tax=Tomitella fengzijianii TaxID=2597660 RepID=A0A516X511_9ACTN|nr:ABC-F family ATP-binding cassette domain-containing protein [Tomitella fengzijianii]QDQ98156.1 ABC-F family ATP-binding cassette domain-containing protein [Tomitella fengzijianii]